MSLIILTTSPKYSFRKCIITCKSIIKQLYGQKRGPDAVVDSLTKGLLELGYDFLLNPKVKNIDAEDTVYVNGSIDALKWAIEAKKGGRIKKLVVGPVMVVLPNEKGSVMCSEYIDIVITPSQWVKDLWLSIASELESRIAIWAAGVELPLLSTKNRTKVLVYKKHVDDTVFHGVTRFLQTNNILFEVVEYGHYSQEKYFRFLEESMLMIYLTESESQGLALCEAWARDVPTLVWNRGFWTHKDNVWHAEKISAPYLTKESGHFFTDVDEFTKMFQSFVDELELFSPRTYVEQQFQNRVIAENFLALIIN